MSLVCAQNNHIGVLTNKILTPQHFLQKFLRVPPEIDVWICDTLYNYSEIVNDFTKYLKQNCW